MKTSHRVTKIDAGRRRRRSIKIVFITRIDFYCLSPSLSLSPTLSLSLTVDLSCILERQIEVISPQSAPEIVSIAFSSIRESRLI